MKNFLIVPFLLMSVFIAVSCSAPTSSSRGAATADPAEPAVDPDPWTAAKFNQNVYTFLKTRNSASYFKIGASGDKMVLYVSKIILNTGAEAATFGNTQAWTMNSARAGGDYTVLSFLIPNKPELQMTTDNASGTKYRLVYNNANAQDGTLEKNSGSGWVKVGDFRFAGKLK